MSYYMVTFGEFEITEAYLGKTGDDAITRARGKIDAWLEYAAMSNEEIIVKLRREDITEFDLVKISSDFPGYDIPLETIRTAYDKKSAMC